MGDIGVTHNVCLAQMGEGELGEWGTMALHIRVCVA